MKFIAEINIMPLKALLDPQGKAVTNSMHNIGFNQIANVRIGKHITLEIDETTQELANAQVEKVCKQMLANQIMESYEFITKLAE